MVEVCALLLRFISSFPSPGLDPNIYSALRKWSVKPGGKSWKQPKAAQDERLARCASSRLNLTGPRERDDRHLRTDCESKGNQNLHCADFRVSIDEGGLSEDDDEDFDELATDFGRHYSRRVYDVTAVPAAVAGAAFHFGSSCVRQGKSVSS
ncbi:hypothetical protein PAXINDRAFT_102883 [Paxillus involutus ATCC 200175]|uniref:Unplaced genomic scaffold PAXINscaffold_513, whole genome shotgun sequence n=1 Tax=Paxillus involutus ATCC 200175 TaxID=664439 RepID=A0A0C9TI67_PAXIN|nr:hypothetical protein PAXINDRAFT_102883 [Paxillus involutus ATCC 200175]